MELKLPIVFHSFLSLLRRDTSCSGDVKGATGGWSWCTDEPEPDEALEKQGTKVTKETEVLTILKLCPFLQDERYYYLVF